MKKTILVYKSETGFTKRYAEWIARETGCDLMELKKLTPAALKGYELVVFGSRLYAGTLDGLKKMMKIHAQAGAGQLILFATGSAPAAVGDIERTWKTNLSAEQLAAIPHFYMQSGLNYEDMCFIDRMLMKMLAIILRMKKNPSKESKALSRTIEKSFDSSDPKFIIPLVEYLKNA